MGKYIYEGPVTVFDKCVENRWRGETYAVSEAKARSNLTYQWKKRNNLVANTVVKLPGKVRRA